MGEVSLNPSERRLGELAITGQFTSNGEQIRALSKATNGQMPVEERGHICFKMLSTLKQNTRRLGSFDVKTYFSES